MSGHEQPERRTNSMETILVALGELKSHSTHIKEKVDSLDVRVGIQNGKVSKLERWQAFMQGAIMILTVMVVPILINFVSSWLEHTFKAQIVIQEVADASRHTEEDRSAH